MSRESEDSVPSGSDGGGKRRAGSGAKAGAANGPGEARRERLAQALRDNLKKRKAQQRQRRGGGPAEP